MSVYYLVNAIRFNAGNTGILRLFPGTRVDSTRFDIAALQAAGAELQPTGTGVAAAAVRVNSLRVAQSLSEEAASAIMRSGVARDAAAAGTTQAAAVVALQGADVTDESAIAANTAAIAASGAAAGWLDKASPFTVSAGSFNIDLTVADITATMPAAPADDETHSFKVLAPATKTLTIDFNGKTGERLDGSYASTFVTTAGGTEVTFVYEALTSKWNLG